MLSSLYSCWDPPMLQFLFLIIDEKNADTKKAISINITSVSPDLMWIVVAFIAGPWIFLTKLSWRSSPDPGSS